MIARPALLPTLLALACCATAAAEAPSWVFRQSSFTHDPQTGARVAQYERVEPVEDLPDSRLVTSGYRRTRTTLLGPNGTVDSSYQVQSFANGKGGIDAEWERFSDEWRASFLTGSFINQEQHAQSGYGYPGYGQTGYGHPGYGQPGYGPSGGYNSPHNQPFFHPPFFGQPYGLQGFPGQFFGLQGFAPQGFFQPQFGKGGIYQPGYGHPYSYGYGHPGYGKKSPHGGGDHGGGDHGGEG